MTLWTMQFVACMAIEYTSEQLQVRLLRYMETASVLEFECEVFQTCGYVCACL